MEEPPLTPEELEEYQEMQEDAADETQEDQFLNSQENAEAYGSPEPEEKHNQHTFLSNAVKAPETLRVTYLDEHEVGRPLFSIRFLLDMKSIAEHYLGQLSTDLKIDNNIADYFNQKVKNITDSGMSKGGFAMNLNVTKKMDVMRKKVRVDNIENLKGRKRR